MEWRHIWWERPLGVGSATTRLPKTVVRWRWHL